MHILLPEEQSAPQLSQFPPQSAGFVASLMVSTSPNLSFTFTAFPQPAEKIREKGLRIPAPYNHPPEWACGCMKGKKIDDRTARAGLCVICAEYDASHSCIDERPGAHGRLQCDVERALPKPPAAQCLARFSNGFQFCMARRFCPFPGGYAPGRRCRPQRVTTALRALPPPARKGGREALLPACNPDPS